MNAHTITIHVAPWLLPAILGFVAGVIATLLAVMWAAAAAWSPTNI